MPNRSEDGKDRDARLGDGLDAEVEGALSPDGDSSARVRPYHALIPEAVIASAPEDFLAFLEAAFAAPDEIDAAVERGLHPTADETQSSATSIRALLPDAALNRAGPGPDTLLDEVFAGFDEIDSALASLRATTTTAHAPAARAAVVTDDVLADPELLVRTIDRLTSEAEKFELLVRQARHALRRLQRYRLSRRPLGVVLEEMRRADDVVALQYAVEFLHAIHTAASSFEALDLPKLHIRDYLEYLYRMESWDELGTLVRKLQRAVERFLDGERRGGRPAAP